MYDQIKMTRVNRILSIIIIIRIYARVFLQQPDKTQEGSGENMHQIAEIIYTIRKVLNLWTALE